MYLTPMHINYLDLKKANQEIFTYLENNDWYATGYDINVFYGIKYLRTLDNFEHINAWLDTFITSISFAHVNLLKANSALKIHMDTLDKPVRLLYPITVGQPQDNYLDYFDFEKGLDINKYRPTENHPSEPYLEDRMHFFKGLPFIINGARPHSVTNNSNTDRIIIQIQFKDSNYEEYCKLAKEGRLANVLNA